MGATDFYALHKCDTDKVSARVAFDTLRAEAQYDHGHGGYTGTIAEKNSFVVLTPPTEDDKLAVTWAQQLLADGDQRVDDKWGPAGCVRLSTGWYFFGYASD